jgi:hypothetical protein
LIASLYILARRRVGQRPGWLPWMAPGVGTAASRAANIGIGGHDLVGRLLAGWPAVALLVSIKLLFGMFKQEDAVPAVRDDQQTSADPADVPKSVHGTVSAGDRAATLDARSVTDLLPRRADRPDRAGERRPLRRRHLVLPGPRQGLDRRRRTPAPGGVARSRLVRPGHPPAAG